MNQRRQRLFTAIAAAGGLLALPILGWSQEGNSQRFPSLGGGPGLQRMLRLVSQELLNQEAPADEEASADRWIGVQVTELPPVLKKHLKLEHGVLAEDVLPDAPAAKAGIEQFDVLLTIEGKEITRPEDVRDAVEGAEEGEALTFQVLHAGEKTTVKIVPAARPDERVILNPTATPSGAAASQQEFLRHQHQAMKALERALADRQAAGMMFMRPGIVTQKPLELPKDVTVNIMHRAGKKRISVERGKEQWEVTEDTLDQLPEELQGPVGALVNGPMPFSIRLPNQDNEIRIPDGGKVRIETVPPKAHVRRVPDNGDEQMEAVLKELKVLRKQLDDVQRTLKNKQ